MTGLQKCSEAKRKHLTCREAGEDSFSINIFKQAPLNRHNTIEIDHLWGAMVLRPMPLSTPIKPLAEEQYVGKSRA